MNDEIKPSFSWKYILLILVTAIITSGIAIIIQEYQKKDELKKIAINVRGGYNEISKNNYSAINVKYSLKNDTSQVKGYYRKSILINNIGNKSLENLTCKILSRDNNIILIPTPKFESYPKEVGQIDFKLNKISDFENHVIIPLLNINESLSISYEAYSKKPVPIFETTVTIRQKDLKIERTDNIILKRESSIISDFWDILKYILLGALSASLLLSFTFYNIWKNDLELRQKYKNNFWAYWWKGF